MQTGPRSTVGARLALAVVALALALVALVSVGWSQELPEERPLTPAQEAEIREEMAALARLLVSGGKSEQEARLATQAVGVCLGTAYSYGLTREQADRVCGLVLDAFIIQPGTTIHELTAEDRAWIAGRVLSWTDDLTALLEPERLAAVQSTMQACLEGHLRRGDERDEAVRHCALGLLPLLNRPELRDRLLEGARALP